MNKIVTLQIVLLVGDWATRCFKRPDHKFTKECLFILILIIFLKQLIISIKLEKCFGQLNKSSSFFLVNNN